MRKRFLKNPGMFLAQGALVTLLCEHHERVMKRGPRARYIMQADLLQPQLDEAKRLMKTAISEADTHGIDIDKEIEDAMEGLGDDDKMLDLVDYVICNSDISQYAVQIREFSEKLIKIRRRIRFGVRGRDDKRLSKINDRACRLMRGVSSKHPPHETMKRIAKAQVRCRLRHATVDDPDHAAALLHEKYPWMRQANAAFLDDARRPGPFRMRPIILAGNSGSGKTSWARDLSRASGAPFIRVDLSASTGGVFELQGQEAGWSGSQPGAVVRGIGSSLFLNPVVVVEEVDMGSIGINATGGRTVPGAAAALMSMIEPETAARWRCPSSGGIMDLTGISWIMTTNYPQRIPEPLLDRCRVILVPELSECDIEGAAWKAAEERFEGAGDAVVEAIRERQRCGKPVRTLRSVRKMVELMEAVMARPMLH